MAEYVLRHGSAGLARAGMGFPAWGAYPYGAGYPPVAATPTREQELDGLKGQAEYFEGALGDLRKRIEELEAEKAEK